MTKSIGELIEIKISRRNFVIGASSLFAASMLPRKAAAFQFNKKSEHLQFNKLDFPYKYETLIGWGEQIVAGDNVAANQFGYNCDWIAYMPLEGSKRGLLCVNNETADSKLMFPKGLYSTEELAAQEMLAIGHSIVEVYNENGIWAYEPESKYNRRINASETEFEISGPATEEIGTSVFGTVNNCGGGKTPWNTILSCEENFNGYFYGEDERYGIDLKKRFADWVSIDERFGNMEEAKRFGWVWELDPYDPKSKPVKRTALGRFKHESAVCAKAGDNVAIYMGDDEVDEFIYKYIGTNLDDGTLYAARFDENKVTWMPIPKERLVRTREAASDLGATPMDRPEDITIDPRTGEVYIAMSKGSKRKTPNPANPRAHNIHGHIIKLKPQSHNDLEHDWDIFLLGNEILSCPDNLCFSPDGRLWVATDGNEGSLGRNDGLYMIDNLDKPMPKQVLSVPNGAEPTGPEFTPDGKTMFLAIQHPGEFSSYEKPSTRWPHFENGKPPCPSVIAINLDY